MEVDLRQRAETGGGYEALVFANYLLAARALEDAVKWFHIAAERGNPDAMTRLSEFYRHGRLVEKDEVRADEFLLAALDLENQDAT